MDQQNSSPDHSPMGHDNNHHSSHNPQSASILQQVEDTCQMYLVDKAPAIPDNIREILVKIAPYLTIIMVIVSIPAILLLFGLAPLVGVAGVMGGEAFGGLYYLSILVLLVQVVIQALAISGLFNRSMSAWRLMFYGVLIGALHSLLSFSLVGLILGTLIGLYILFQVKKYYR